MNTIDICNELHQNFIDFAYEANSQRAFADARDGLKPGQRACLWEMYSKGYTSNKPHVKSAKISGGVIANWWPHGDVAIYETFARMSQSWINNIPEVNWHGANGNIVIGNEPASARYTEAKLDKATEEGMFQGIKKQNVPMILNFSEDEEWPEVLPAIMPRLLINGCQGIGVTISNTWLPMNLKEITRSIKKYALTGELDINEGLIDFPSGGIIINKDNLSIIHKTGKGKVILRAKAEVKGKSILITELPYQVFVEPLMDEIKALLVKDELDDIKDIYNKTDKKRLLIEIECKNSPESTLKKLYAMTSLQKNYNTNQFALVGKTPKLLTLKEYYDIYLNHNKTCIRKEYEYDLNKAKVRLNIVEGLLIALEDIDNVVQLIKKSKNAAAAKDTLKETYNLNEEQAKAIVDMKLGRIANLEKLELENEKQKLIDTIKEINEILSNEKTLLDILLKRLEDFTKKYGYDRRTELQNFEIKPEEKEIETVTPEDVVVVINKTGEIKRIAKASFRTQRKGGKGIKTEDDAVLGTFSTNTIDTLLAFTNTGKMFRLLIDNIPAGTNISKGVGIGSLINLEPSEKVIAATTLERKNNKKYVVFMTKQGLIKKTLLEEYTQTKRSTGIAAIKLKEGDSIANIELMNEEEMIIITKKGMSIHFDTKDIAAIGRVTTGVKAIKLDEDDEVLVGLPILNNENQVAVITEYGYGKKTKVDEFPFQGRAGKGVVIYKTTPSTGKIIGAAIVNDESNLLLVGKTSICISAKDIPLLGRSATGNIMIKSGSLNSIVEL